MKTLLLALGLLALPCLAANNCDGAVSAYTDFTGTSGAIVPQAGDKRVVVCQVELSAAAATDFSIAGTTSGTVVIGGLGVVGYFNNAVNGSVKGSVGDGLTLTLGTSTHVRVRVAFYYSLN